MLVFINMLRERYPILSWMVLSRLNESKRPTIHDKMGMSDSKQTLVLDTAIYSLEAIKKVAYRFADRASVLITPCAGSTVAVRFTFAGSAEKNEPKLVMADFCNELLDQDLREIIKTETQALRSVIIAHAFSRSALIEQE